MPIKVDVVNSNSTINVKPKDNTSNVKLNSGDSVDLRRIDALIEQLQRNKQDLGFIYVSDYLDPGQYHGTFTQSALNLLKMFLINKLNYSGSIYSLAKINNNIFDYICSTTNPNTIRLDITNGFFEIINEGNLDHAHLKNLGYIESGHTGFAGILYGTTEEWESDPTYKTINGIIYVYTDYAQDELGNNIPAIKIGDGNAYLVDKPFVEGDVLKDLNKHVENLTIHVTLQDKLMWDTKANLPEANRDVDDDIYYLEFTNDRIDKRRI